MGDYTRLDIEEAREILEHYNLSQIDSITPLSLGISNSNYKVISGNETYLLKVSNDKNVEEIKQEMQLLTYLNTLEHPHNLVPFSTTDNLYVYTYEDKFGVLFKFLDGIPPGPSDVACEEIGKALAKLHTLQHTDGINKIRHHESVGFGARQVYEFAKSSQCPTEYSEAFEHIFPHSLQWFIDHPWDAGIIHGDLYYDNTLFKNEKIQMMVDFEQAGRGEYILDLGISISGTCLEKGRLSSGLIRSYLSGYESIRKLPQEEKIHIVDAIFVGLFSISLWRIKRFREKNLNPLMTDSYLELLHRAQVFNETLKMESLL